MNNYRGSTKLLTKAFFHIDICHFFDKTIQLY